MDWPMEDLPWSSADLGLFEFETRPTVVLRKLESHTTVIKNLLEDKNQWENWFDCAMSSASESNQFYAVLLSRASPIFDEDAPVSYVSVSRDTWERLTRLFHIDRGITRSIARQVACISSCYEESEGVGTKICFTARTSKYLSGDLALSVTYIPSTESIYTVMYGCNKDQIKKIESRVRSAGDRIKYPLSMIGILFELEKERLVSIADQLLDKFTLRSEHLENGSWDPSIDMNKEKTQEHLELCLQSRNLIDHMKAVRRQMVKLLAEVEEFEDYISSDEQGRRSHDDSHHDERNERERWFKKMGHQMKKRLHDIINEYDGKMDECDMIAANITLAMQTVWNQIAMRDSDLNTRIAHVNTEVALDTKREGIQMRSIAILSMIYLPFSSVAALFSMDMFDWNPQDGDSVVSKYIWLFAVLAVGLTAITVCAWYHITTRHEKKADGDAQVLQRKITGLDQV
ncbi:uncharacterized protein F4812DRAFT_132311 [Daldinia caldariorum]|uniref:uncharacterized protein n=1 Tax=Daldinia caldariorum TaxID=326644 RepID=UPI002008DEE4|nr:uncharacterized protein F4812DRAFT_132311 [Daldinia caldariorum]KAI1465106.1 hypothetical protein F4812DRAFT_132311 [Daldinia caldariorum]